MSNALVHYGGGKDETAPLTVQAPDMHWLFTIPELQESASVVAGMPWRTELIQRAEAVRTMIEVAVNVMKLPTHAIASACLYLHRFYMKESMQKYPLRVNKLFLGRTLTEKGKEMMPTTLFLACKVEESTRKAVDIVKYFLQREAWLSGQDQIMAVENSPEHTALYQRVLYNEDVLLRTLLYELSPEHPEFIASSAISLLTVENNLTLTPFAWDSAYLDSYEDTRVDHYLISQHLKSIVVEITALSLLTPICLLKPPNVIAAVMTKMALIMDGIDIDNYDIHSNANYDLNISSGKAFYAIFQTHRGIVDRALQLFIEFVDPLIHDGKVEMDRWRSIVEKITDKVTFTSPLAIRRVKDRHPKQIFKSGSDSLLQLECKPRDDFKPISMHSLSLDDSKMDLHEEELLRVEDGNRKEEDFRAKMQEG